MTQPVLDPFGDLFRILSARDGAPHDDDLGLDRENGVERLRPEAARKGDTEAPTMHFLDSVDMAGRAITRDAHVGRRMDADIREAWWKGRVRGQDFRFAGLGDRVDNDKAAEP
jgi:hypothetical protein